MRSVSISSCINRVSMRPRPAEKQMLGVFAEFERAMTQERVRAGLARARADGKIVGRPKIAEKTERAVRSALSKKDRPGPYSAGNALFRLRAGKPMQK
jgi:DNA invertase Pin-like site-specific DNA recombinase